MTVKLSLLKSGEDVIADIEEMILDEKVVGYFFNDPCIVKLLAKDAGSRENTLSIAVDSMVTTYK